MKHTKNTANKFNRVVVYLLSLMSMLILAYIDYLTSDYSLVLFYILIVTISSYYTNNIFGILSATLCAVAGAISDYCVHSNEVFSSVYYWNWSCYLIIYVTLSIIIYYMKLKKDR